TPPRNTRCPHAARSTPTRGERTARPAMRTPPAAHSPREPQQTTPSGTRPRSSPASPGHERHAGRPTRNRECPHSRHSTPTVDCPNACAPSVPVKPSTTCSTDMTRHHDTDDTPRDSTHSHELTAATATRRRPRWQAVVVRLTLAIIGGALLYLSHAPRALWWLDPLAFTCLGLLLHRRGSWAGSGY